MQHQVEKALAIGLTLCGFGSVAAGFAPSFGYIIAARIVQGLSVALLSPGAFALITGFLPDGPVRHKALGVFGVPTMVFNDELFWGGDRIDLLVERIKNPESIATALGSRHRK